MGAKKSSDTMGSISKFVKKELALHSIENSLVKRHELLHERIRRMSGDEPVFFNKRVSDAGSSDKEL